MEKFSRWYSYQKTTLHLCWRENAFRAYFKMILDGPYNLWLRQMDDEWAKTSLAWSNRQIEKQREAYLKLKFANISE